MSATMCVKSPDANSSKHLRSTRNECVSSEAPTKEAILVALLLLRTSGETFLVAPAPLTNRGAASGLGFRVQGLPFSGRTHGKTWDTVPDWQQG